MIVSQARIKKIMQTDEDVGKIAMAVPLLVCEYFFKVCSTCFYLYIIYLFLILSLMILSVAVHRFCFTFSISPFLLFVKSYFVTNNITVALLFKILIACGQCNLQLKLWNYFCKIYVIGHMRLLWKEEQRPWILCICKWYLHLWTLGFKYLLWG